MRFKKIKLYFAKRKLRKLYTNVQKLAGDKLILRKAIQVSQEELLSQLDTLRDKFSIENPKQYVETKRG